MKRFLAPALVTLTLSLTACGGDDESASKNPTEENTGLVAAEDVKASQATATDVELGEFTDLGGGVLVRIDSPEAGGDDFGPWLEVQVRVENTSEANAYVPEVAIWCAGSTEGGGYQADSTLLFGDEIPAGAFKEGVLNLLTPGDSRTGEPATACEGPAYVEASLVGLVPDDAVPGRWTLPAEVVDQLNPAR